MKTIKNLFNSIFGNDQNPPTPPAQLSSISFLDLSIAMANNSESLLLQNNNNSNTLALCQ